MMDKKIVVVITAIALIVPNNSDKDTASYDTSFQKVLDSWFYFIDKTLFLKTLFEKGTPAKILIRAPHGYGKSTNMNMVKQFLEINFYSHDGNQSRITIAKKTPNYNLFTNTKHLKICKQQELFDEHLGKYPVIFIDYKPLISDGVTTSFDGLLNRINKVLRNSFAQHTYLLKSSKLWSATQDKLATQVQFNKFVGQQKPYKNTELSETDIKNGFTLLAQLLFKEFGKLVFVLIDDFDTYMDSLDFAGNMDADRIVAFIQSINGDLLKSNCVSRALLMSTHRQVNKSTNSFCHVDNSAINNVTEYRFLDDHIFNEYHGISENEMNVLLDKTVSDDVERILTKDIINEHVVCHSVGNRNIKLYTTFPVVNFLRHRRRIGYRLVSSDF